VSLRIDEFDYLLPKELIAQHPQDERASSRLLVLGRDQEAIEHRHFRDLEDYLRAGDVLVLNNTRVLPARISAIKPTGGRVDILMVEELVGTRWSCLVNGVKKSAGEQTVQLGGVTATVGYSGEAWEIVFPEEVDVRELLSMHGRMPLPPYIRRGQKGSASNDFDRYQTVYAEKPGSIAAPTAGLHFTGELLRALSEKGVTIAHITLHIGIGTFFLIKKEKVEDHQMHREWYSIEPAVVEAIEKARTRGGRIIAVGTSAVRTLETFFSREERSDSGYSDLFIYPGYRFKIVDMLLTNFHLPRSTPLLLASAFAGKENLLSAYSAAIEKGYRFYSYGDAMLIQ
jgi:S-adenosylmethionine:tRNA ribosyltransferase-isomerase